MDINHLKGFLEIVKTENFSIASENLYLSQSSLSKQIKSLEMKLDTQLFDRTTRKIQISKAGEIIKPYAERMTALYDEMKRNLALFKTNNQNKLHIGALPVMYYYHIIELLSDFNKSHPDIEFELVEYNDHNIIQALENHDFELAFWGDGTTDINVDKIATSKDELVVVLPKEHKLAGEDIIDLKDLSQSRYCFMDKRTPIYEMSMQTCRKAGFDPIIFFTYVRPENAIDLVSTTNCVALMMREYTKRINLDDVVVKKIIPSFSRHINLIKLKNQKLSKTAKVFWDFIKDLKQQLSD